MSDDEYRVSTRRLNKEEEERMVTRLYDESVELQKQRMAELDQRYYPVAAPVRISNEDLQRSVERQVDQEMELRRTRRAEVEAHLERCTPPVVNRRASAVNRTADGGVVMTSEEVDASVQRMYEETLANKQARLEESRRRHAPPQPKTKKVSKSELKEWVEKSSQAKKREYTIPEINKIYGLTD